MSCNIIEVKNISKLYEIYEKPIHRLLQMMFMGHKSFYKEFYALNNINIKVQKGKCIGIIGRNGAGKSTLLQILAETLAPSSGSLKINGKVAALLELGSGFDFEFTGKENVYMNASLLGLSKKEIDLKYNDIVTFSDIGDAILQPVKTYSTGMAMRLAFSVIAHIDADVLIIDEALAVGDAVFVQKCMRFLRDFKEKNTIILVTHDTSAVLNMCDYAYWLDNGKVKLEGLPKNVIDAYLEFCYQVEQGDDVKVYKKDVPLKQQQSQDIRHDLLNHSNLRNDLIFFNFDHNAPSFGKGGATIESVMFFDQHDTPLVATLGGDIVQLIIKCKCNQHIFSPIIGFSVRNYLGEDLFGDNSYLLYHDKPMICQEGDCLEATFVFTMPRLPAGDYSVHVAIAEGTQDEHVQHQWFHDALLFKSQYTGGIGMLVGLPMNDIKLKLIDDSKILEHEND